MFNDEDEILLEQYITNIGMNKDTRDKCVNLFLHTKEMTDSIYDNGGSKYDLIMLNLKRDDNKVIFNGSVSNGTEDRMIDGLIYKAGNKYVVANNIYRMYEYLEDDDKLFNCVDTFTIKENEIVRKTSYSNTSSYFESQLLELNEIELYDYYYNMIYPNQKKLKNTND